MSVAFYIDYIQGAFDSRYFDSEHFQCEELGEPIYPEFITKFDNNRQKIVFIPYWINKQETLETEHHNQKVITYTYSFRLSHYEKWLFDNAIMHPSIYYLKDTVNNREGEVWLSNISNSWSPTNFKNPWETTIKLLSNSMRPID